MAALSKPTNGSNADYANRIGLLFDAFNNGNYQFPATQVPSADANTLDDYEEGTSTPTVTATSGTITTSSATLRYQKIGNTVYYRATLTITTNGTGAGNIQYTVPFTSTEEGQVHGRENASSGNSLAGVQLSGSATVTLGKYDNTYPAADGYRLGVNGFFSV